MSYSRIYVDPDTQRLPAGMRRIGYDADDQTYTFQDLDGSIWRGQPGNEFGTLSCVKPVAARKKTGSGGGGKGEKDNKQLGRSKTVGSAPSVRRHPVPPRQAPSDSTLASSPASLSLSSSLLNRSMSLLSDRLTLSTTSTAVPPPPYRQGKAFTSFSQLSGDKAHPKLAEEGPGSAVRQVRNLARGLSVSRTGRRGTVG